MQIYNYNWISIKFHMPSFVTACLSCCRKSLSAESQREVFSQSCRTLMRSGISLAAGPTLVVLVLSFVTTWSMRVLAAQMGVNWVPSVFFCSPVKKKKKTVIVLVNCFCSFLPCPAPPGDESELRRAGPVLKDLWLAFNRPETSMSMRLGSDNADGLCGPVPKGFEWLLYISVSLWTPAYWGQEEYKTQRQLLQHY